MKALHFHRWKAACALALFLSSGLASAQSELFTRSVGAPIREVAAGNFFGNEEPTLAVLIGDQLEVWVDPLSFKTTTPVTSVSGVTSMAYQTGSPGQAEPLYVASDAGLSLVRGLTTWGVGTTTHLIGGAWVGALQLSTIDLGGVRNVFGVTAARTKVIIADDQSGSWVTNGELTPPLGTVVDYELVDWDNDGSLEIAILSTAKLWVYELGSSTPFFAVRNDGGSVGALARVPATPLEQLAWATLDAAGDPILSLRNSAGIDAPIALDCPVVTGGSSQPIAIARMAAGDLDADGDVDLALTDFSTHRYVAFLHDALATPHFQSGTEGVDHLLVDVNPANPYLPGTGNDVPPSIGDADNDGVNDVLLGLNSLDLVAVAPDLTDTSSMSTSILISPSSTYDEDNGYTTFNLAFDFTNATEVFDTYDGIQAILWRETGVGSGLENTALAHSVYEFNKGGPGSGDDELQGYFEVRFTDETDYDFETAVYVLRYRFVTVDGTTITSATIGQSCGFDDEYSDANGITTEAAYLLNLNDDVAPFELEEGSAPNTNNSTPGGSAGGWIYTDITPPEVSGTPYVCPLTVVPLARWF